MGADKDLSKRCYLITVHWHDLLTAKCSGAFMSALSYTCDFLAMKKFFFFFKLQKDFVLQTRLGGLWNQNQTPTLHYYCQEATDSIIDGHIFTQVLNTVAAPSPVHSVHS